LLPPARNRIRLSVYLIDQASGKLGDPTRYPVGRGANRIEMVEVQ
jgi:hypothetical protein